MDFNANGLVDEDFVPSAQLSPLAKLWVNFVVDPDASFFHHPFGVASCGGIPGGFERLHEVDEWGAEMECFGNHGDEGD